MTKFVVYGLIGAILVIILTSFHDDAMVICLEAHSQETCYNALAK